MKLTGALEDSNCAILILSTFLLFFLWYLEIEPIFVVDQNRDVDIGFPLLIMRKLFIRRLVLT